MTTSTDDDAWGELRSLLHAHYPSFPALWRCLMLLRDDERHAAARYTQRAIGMVAAGLSLELASFEDEVLEAWIMHLVWAQLWRHIDLFEPHPELLEQVLADLALREHVHDAHISDEALTARRLQVREDGTYYALSEQSEWVQGLVVIVLEPEVVKCTQDLHQHISQWNAMPDAQQRLADEVRGGIGRARDTLLGGLTQGRGVLPSLLGGGLGIGQLFGVGMHTIQQATDSLTRLGSAFSISREEALSELEDHMVRFCLEWASHS